MGMLLRARLLLLSLMQRLRRSIWLRRSRRLTRLTERQLKQMWVVERIRQDPSQSMFQAAEKLLPEWRRMPLDIPVSRQTMEEMEDLQNSSRQLTRANSTEKP